MKVIEAKAGKKFKPGSFVYVRRLFEENRMGIIIRYCGWIEAYGTKEKQEVYEVLIGRKMSLFNEVLLDSLNRQTCNKLSKKTKN